MGIRLAMQPFWVRALFYGVLFGVFLGTFTAVSSQSRVLGAVITGLSTGVMFGLAMAYQTKFVHTEMSEAVSGLDAAARTEAISAVMDGGTPADSAVRYSALRLGKAFLRLKSDADLRKGDWRPWLMFPVFCGAAALLAIFATNKYETAYAVLLGLVWVFLAPWGATRRRRMKRNLLRLVEGPVAP